jgi:transposase
LEDRFVSRLDDRLEAEGEGITGATGRRRWSTDERAQILEETLVPGAVVSEVARRHGLTPQKLFTWRREARKAAQAVPTFVPAVITPEPVLVAEPPAALPRRERRSRHHRRAAAIELDVAGVKVTIENGASPATIEAVLGALKAGS